MATIIELQNAIRHKKKEIPTLILNYNSAYQKLDYAKTRLAELEAQLQKRLDEIHESQTLAGVD